MRKRKETRTQAEVACICVTKKDGGPTGPRGKNVEQSVGPSGTDPGIAPGATGHHQRRSKKVDQSGFAGARKHVSLTALDTG